MVHWGGLAARTRSLSRYVEWQEFSRCLSDNYLLIQGHMRRNLEAACQGVKDWEKRDNG